MIHAIPADALKQHLAILGKTGSGKTSTEKLAVEQVVAAGFRVCVLDSVKSDWWGITSSANGKKPGLPFQILGGPHGHVPLHSSAGKVIGQLVGSGKLPLSIIDMADFEAGGLQRFFIDFAQALMRSAKGVVYLVIEEAHEFAPKEKSGVGNENMATHWAKKLATAGRSKGIRLIVATQRIQALHNAVLGSCETLIAHRLSAPADQDPVMKWLRANTDKLTADKVMGGLSSLPTGTGWVCSGESKIFEMVKFPKFKTYDNAVTPESDAKEITVKTAPVDRDKLSAIIGDAVKEAEANDPAALKKRIRELEAEAKKKTIPAAAGPSNKELQTVRADGHKQGYAEGFKDGATKLSAELSERIKAVLAKSFADLENKKIIAPQPVSISVELKKPVMPHTPITKFKVVDKIPKELIAGNGEYTGPQRRIINSLIFWKSIGHEQPTRAQAAVVAGYAWRSASFRNPASALKTLGVIDWIGTNNVKLTGDVDGGMSAEQAKSKLLSILSGPQRKIIEAFEGSDKPQPKEPLAARAGYDHHSASFRNPASALATLGIIEKVSSDEFQMADWAREVLV